MVRIGVDEGTQINSENMNHNPSLINQHASNKNIKVRIVIEGRAG